MDDQQSRQRTSARHSRAYAGLFLIFLACGLAAGLQVGRSLFRSNQHLTAQALPGQARLAQPATGQNSWLVIGVDDLQAAAPRLQSAWLALFFPGQPAVTLLPLFPVPQADSLEEAFSLNRNGAPAEDFLIALRGQRLWWTGYLVLDSKGLAKVIDYIQGGGETSAFFPALQGTSSGSIPELESVSSLQGQSDLLERACRQANGSFDSAEIIQLVAGLSPHLRTDLDLAQVARAWPQTEAGRLMVGCEFPVLAVSR